MKIILRYLIRRLLGGAAFGIGIILILAIAFFAAMPRLSYVFVPVSDEKHTDEKPLPHNTNFGDLTTPEKIKISSAIALGSFRHTRPGEVTIIVDEYLKKNPGTRLTYAVGEEVSDALSPQAASNDLGDGVVIFFVGSPTQTKMTATYMNGVIPGLRNISIDDFRHLIASRNGDGVEHP